MQLKKIPVNKINLAPYNPRIDLQPDDPEYQNLKRSIKEFGYVEPLVWNEQSGNLVGGHQRLKVLLESNPAEIEVSVVNLNEEKEKALNLALNKISGDWDDYKLSQLLQELNETDLNMELTGFDEGELSKWLGDIQAEGTSTFNQNQELSLDDYEEDQFSHTCPKCGFSFNDD